MQLPFRTGLTTATFARPGAFWAGCALIVCGVLAHLPMFGHASHMDYQMVGMPMDSTMILGMVGIVAGLALSAFGLFRSRANLARMELGMPAVAVGTPGLNSAHWSLLVALAIALTIDVMKPATLGFVMPGIAKEYEISKQVAGMLALVALTGTTVGSVVWGRLADAYGRRAAILLSALMFIGTSICGAMPSFEWNLAMCFLMGASAGGMLPIAFTLMSETIPAKHRGWLLVALGGIATSAGYLCAATAARYLEPVYSWRVLWLLGLPTGVLLVFLNRFIPESPRFLAQHGLAHQAQTMLQKFAVTSDTLSNTAVDTVEQTSPTLRTLLTGGYGYLSLGLALCGIGWGLVNFGFLLWLPTNLRELGMTDVGAGQLLARAAMFATPGIVLVVWLYHSWSTIKTLLLFELLTTGALATIALCSVGGIQDQNVIAAAVASLLIGSGGVIAVIVPYAAEIYPLHLRATGTGMIAASTKFGGILGAGFGVYGAFAHPVFSSACIIVPIVLSVIVLARAAIETRGRSLEEIHELVIGQDGI